ncbi:hypothetical protein E8E11_005281 [Didymella keratinophila]|nr:hypothetical protein E8E11_005281 [Didymella keratinophila]
MPHAHGLTSQAHLSKTHTTQEKQNNMDENTSERSTGEPRIQAQLHPPEDASTLPPSVFSGSATANDTNIDPPKDIVNLAKTLVQRITKDKSHLHLGRLLSRTTIETWKALFEHDGRDGFAELAIFLNLFLAATAHDFVIPNVEGESTNSIVSDILRTITALLISTNSVQIQAKLSRTTKKRRSSTIKPETAVIDLLSEDDVTVVKKEKGDDRARYRQQNSQRRNRRGLERPPSRPASSKTGFECETESESEGEPLIKATRSRLRRGRQPQIESNEKESNGENGENNNGEEEEHSHDDDYEEEEDDEDKEASNDGDSNQEEERLTRAQTKAFEAAQTCPKLPMSGRLHSSGTYGNDKAQPGMNHGERQE